MSKLTDQIEALERNEIRLLSLQNKVLQELGSFVSAWDSGNPDQLPTNRAAMINEVRSVLDYVIRTHCKEV